jgi:hypothetical protein
MIRRSSFSFEGIIPTLSGQRSTREEPGRIIQMNLQYIKYSLFVWLTVGIFSPLVFALLSILFDRESIVNIFESFWTYWGVAIMVGLLYSIPSLILLWIALLFFGKSGMSILQKKMILILLTMCLLIITFRLMVHGGIPILELSGFLLFISYFFSVSLALAVFRLEKKPSGPAT